MIVELQLRVNPPSTLFDPSPFKTQSVSNDLTVKLLEQEPMMRL